MSGMKKGLAALAEYQEESARRAEERTKRINKLWLKENEMAKIYFVNDGDEVLLPMIHSLPLKTKDGRDYKKDVLCGKQTSTDDDGKCDFCDDKIPGPWMRTCILVYVDTIYHKAPNEEKGWKKKGTAGNYFYEEVVRDTWLLIAQGKLAPQIIKEYVGDPVNPKDTPTLLDRAFKLTRTGSGQAKVEILEGQTPAQAPDYVVEARTNPLNLEEVIKNEFSYVPYKPATGNAVDYSKSDDADLLNYGSAASSDDELISFE